MAAHPPEKLPDTIERLPRPVSNDMLPQIGDLKSWGAGRSQNYWYKVAKRGDRYAIVVDTASLSLHRAIMVAAQIPEAYSGAGQQYLVRDCACDGKSDAVTGCMAKNWAAMKMAGVAKYFGEQGVENLARVEPMLAIRVQCAKMALAASNELVRRDA